MSDLVTIVIPTADRPGTAARAIASALAQTHPSIEVVVVDDGTNAQRVPAPTDARVRVRRTGGRVGASAARNVGLAAATGRWVTFLDDDDELDPGMVARSLAAIGGSALPPPVAAVNAMEERAPDGSVRTVRVPRAAPRGGAWTLDEPNPDRREDLQAFNALLAPVDVLRAIGGFDARLRAAMHTDLFVRLHAVCSLEAVPEVGYRLHHHDAPRLSAGHRVRGEAMRLTYAAHRDAFAARPQRAGEYLADAGWYFLRGGAWGPAARCGLHQLAVAPRRPKAVRDAVALVLAPLTRRLLARRG